MLSPTYCLHDSKIAILGEDLRSDMHESSPELGAPRTVSFEDDADSRVFGARQRQASKMPRGHDSHSSDEATESKAADPEDEELAHLIIPSRRG